jgi:hypothetical protein
VGRKREGEGGKGREGEERRGWMGDGGIVLKV